MWIVNVRVFSRETGGCRARWGKLTAEAERPAESDISIVAFALTRDFCAVSVIAKVRESFSPQLWRGWGLILY